MTTANEIVRQLARIDLSTPSAIKFTRAEICAAALETLESPHADLRRGAVELLAWSLPNVDLVPHLARHLADPDDNVRHASAALLLNHEDPVAARIVDAALASDPDRLDFWDHDRFAPAFAQVWVRRAAFRCDADDISAEALGQLGSIPGLRRLVEYGVGEPAELACGYLARFDCEEARDAIALAFKCGDEWVRYFAAKAMAERPHPDHVATIAAHWDGPSTKFVRDCLPTAVQALTRAAQLPAARSAVQKLRRHEHPGVALAALLALRGAGDQSLDSELNAVDAEDTGDVGLNETFAVLLAAARAPTEPFEPEPPFQPRGQAWWNGLPAGRVRRIKPPRIPPSWRFTELRHPRQINLDRAQDAWRALPVVGHVLGVQVRWVGPLVDQGHTDELTWMSEDGFGDKEALWSEDLPTDASFLLANGTIEPAWQAALVRAACRLDEDRWPPDTSTEKWLAWLFFEVAAPAGALKRTLG